MWKLGQKTMLGALFLIALLRMQSVEFVSSLRLREKCNQMMMIMHTRHDYASPAFPVRSYDDDDADDDATEMLMIITMHPQHRQQS